MALSRIIQTASFVLERGSRAFCLPKLLRQEIVHVDKVLEDLDAAMTLLVCLSVCLYIGDDGECSWPHFCSILHYSLRAEGHLIRFFQVAFLLSPCKAVRSCGSMWRRHFKLKASVGNTKTRHCPPRAVQVV